MNKLDNLPGSIKTLIGLNGIPLVYVLYYLFVSESEWRGSAAFLMFFIGPAIATLLLLVAAVVAIRNIKEHKISSVLILCLPVLLGLLSLSVGSRFPW